MTYFTVRQGINREHLKYFMNIYCGMTNHRKDQDMQTSHKTTNYNKRSCLRFSFPVPDFFSRRNTINIPEIFLVFTVFTVFPV